MTHWRRYFNLAAALLGVLYPVAVWQSEAIRPVTPTYWLLAICVLRLFSTRSNVERSLLAGTAGLAALMTFDDDPRVARFYPVLVNAILLIYFASTVIWPPTVIERFARLRHRAFPQRAVDYTRRVTLIWCGFFLINGSVALATSLWASTEVWSLYNGAVCYGLIGLLVAVEWIFFRRPMWRLAREELGRGQSAA